VFGGQPQQSIDLNIPLSESFRFLRGSVMGKERGFSVIEFLVVGAIVGILALIAVPQYSMYRQKGYNTSAANDLRNVAAAQEAFFAQHGKYFPVTHCTSPDHTSQCKIEGLPGVSELSKGVNLNITASAGGFSGSSKHVKSGSTCKWDSTQGGMLGCSKQ
jgi:type IV pilus assembly protein PilA